MMRAWVGKLALLLAAILVAEDGAKAGEAYYYMVFGSQVTPKRLKYVHAFGAFVRVTWDDATPDRPVVQEMHAISWEPATLDVHVWTAHSEPGTNLDLYRTLSLVIGEGQRVKMFGPFRVRKLLYDRSITQWWKLQRHEIVYRAIDSEDDKDIADCIHAMTDVDPAFGRGHYPLIRVGWDAARYIGEQIVTRSAYNQAEVDASWLVPMLGLDRYPIEVISSRQLMSEMQAGSGCCGQR